MPITDNTDALAQFNMLVQPSVCPTLTTPEQQSILDWYKRGSLWVTNTITNIGAIIIPTLPNRNGHRYKAVEFTTTGTNQKTGATEPSWSVTRDSQVTDGYVIWQEDGWDWDCVLWDFNGAARAGWLLKASKASTNVDIQTSALGITASKLYDHCIAQAERFQPAFVL